MVVVLAGALSVSGCSASDATPLRSGADTGDSAGLRDGGRAGRRDAPTQDAALDRTTKPKATDASTHDRAGHDTGPPVVTLQWTEVSEPSSNVNFEQRFGAAVGPCLFAWDRDDNTTHVARQSSPGVLAPWSTTTPPPKGPTYDTWAVAVGTTLFVGALSGGCFSCYFAATVDTTDCTINGWTQPGGVPGGYGGPWMAGTSYSTGGSTYVYAMGGVYGDAAQKDSGMWGVVDQAAGTVQWTAIDGIGGVSTAGTAIAVQNSLYVVAGGTDNNVNTGPSTSSVRHWTLGSIGSPGALGSGPALPWSGRSVVLASTSRYVYAVGGVAAGSFTHIRQAARAPLTGTGIGSWESVPTLASSLPQGFGVGYLPFAQMGDVIYAFAGGDVGDVGSATLTPDKVLAAVLE